MGFGMPGASHFHALFMRCGGVVRILVQPDRLEHRLLEQRAGRDVLPPGARKVLLQADHVRKKEFSSVALPCVAYVAGAVSLGVPRGVVPHSITLGPPGNGHTNTLATSWTAGDSYRMLIQ